ncbi:MAG: TrpB-like pyridoxal phosphate-dependent enzyme [Candidatus Latescibacterota bacterium]|nr:MAG: TrpB-like pyridoxal phosphate-dependent enzyme [Candidatus Latescibacterota bacterium]
MDRTKIILNESEMPRRWYNIMADLKTPPMPVLHPGTLDPIGPEDLVPIFPMALIEQEVAQDRFIDIPNEIVEAYRLWRPTPLIRAKRLERALETPARIYFKHEGVSPTGSHKPNTAVAQAFYNAKEGVKRLTTETGAGQWGSALSFACSLFDLDCMVYMVKVSYEQKPYRKIMMQTWDADVVASPSMHTNSGREVLKNQPKTSGSLGIAISEAVEDAVASDNAKYSLGSVLNHVLLHQTVIGLEAKDQMETAGDYPDVVIGCVGGGSNFSGIAFPYIRDKLAGRNLRAVAVEPTACPTLTRGVFAYDFGDTAKLTPLLPMFTLGHSFVPPAIHAGGLRYHGGSPLLCDLVRKRLVEARAYDQTDVFDAALVFTRTEGILPAPESAHAIRAAIDEATDAKNQGEERVILFCLSGHGHFDLSAYHAYLQGQLEDAEFPDEALHRALEKLKGVSN